MSQLTWLLSALSGAPAALSVSASFFWSQPSIFTSPMVVTTDFPPSAGTDLNDRPCLVRKSLVRSQSENLLHGPTKMWNWQSVAATVIGVFCRERLERRIDVVRQPGEQAGSRSPPRSGSPP